MTQLCFPPLAALPASKGCRTCGGHDITVVFSPYGTVRRCARCTLAWYPGKDMEWFEQHHSVLADHIEEAVIRGEENARRRLMQSIIEKRRANGRHTDPANGHRRSPAGLAAGDAGQARRR